MSLNPINRMVAAQQRAEMAIHAADPDVETHVVVTAGMRAAVLALAEWIQKLPADKSALPFVRAVGRPTGMSNLVTGEPEVHLNMGDLERFAAGLRVLASPGAL